MTPDNYPPPPASGSLITRRNFVRCAAAATLCSALEGVTAPMPAPGKDLRRDLSPSVQMQFMRPAQLEKALREFPVAYVPFGLIEWHGRHLPLGNDALKASRHPGKGGGAIRRRRLSSRLFSRELSQRYPRACDPRAVSAD